MSPYVGQAEHVTGLAAFLGDQSPPEKKLRWLCTWDGVCALCLGRY